MVQFGSLLLPLRGLAGGWQAAVVIIIVVI
jgi:hypothetical protein